MAISTEVLRARLEEAETAYHSIVLGGAVKVVVDQNGERIEYTAASRASLLAYIMYLRQQLGDATPGPLQVFF